VEVDVDVGVGVGVEACGGSKRRRRWRWRSRVEAVGRWQGGRAGAGTVNVTTSNYLPINGVLCSRRNSQKKMAAYSVEGGRHGHALAEILRVRPIHQQKYPPPV
jgi:hypothetical protein